MNKIKIILYFSILFLFPIPSFSSDEDDFIKMVNTAWSSRNYSLIKNLFENRLQNNQNDPSALAVAQYYYIYAEQNLEQAKNYATRFMSYIESQNAAGAEEIIANLINNIMNLQDNDLITFNQEQKDAIHNMFPDALPGVDACYIVIKNLSEK